MPTPAHNEILASTEAARRNLPVSVHALLDNLPGAHRLALVNALIDAISPGSTDEQLPFMRGRVAGLIEAAELRGDLTSDERCELMLFALGTPAAKNE